MKRAGLLAVSILILAGLFRRVGGDAFATVLTDLDPAWFAAALAMFVPTLWLTALRWRVVAAEVRALSLTEALRMVLAASAANVFLPAKLGDVGKGAFLSRDAREAGVGLAIFEKLADVAALAVWMIVAALMVRPSREPEQLVCVLGVGFLVGFACLCVFPLEGLMRGERAGPFARTLEGVAALRAHPRRLAAVLLGSLFLWGLHLAQFQLAAWSAGIDASPALLASRIPMAIFVGLLPISFAGIGTRDAALVYLLAPHLGEPLALALGAFATLRSLVPAAAGALVAAQGS